MAYCLPKAIARTFAKAIHDGTFDPDEYSDMKSTEERRAYVAKFVGEDDATPVNAELETKLLLNDFKRGMVTAVKKLTGISAAARRDMLTKIENLSGVLSQTDEKLFLNDMADRVLGTHIPQDVANTMAAMSKDVSAARAAIKPDEPDGSDSRLNYGAKRVALTNYINELKLSNKPGLLETAISNVKGGKIGAIAKSASDIGGIAKSMKATGDISTPFRQNMKLIFTDPGIWFKNNVKMLADTARQFKKGADNDDIMNGIQADIQSQKNFLNGYAAKAKLGINVQEEAIPTTIPEKIPFAGRFFKATQVAFQGSEYRMRMDVFNKLVSIAQKQGIDLDNDTKQLPAIGKMINSQTGRGSFGGGEPVLNVLNNLFFSPRMMKGNFDFLTAHTFDTGMTNFVRIRAVKNLVQNVVGVAAVLGLAHTIAPKSVDGILSSDFGKIKMVGGDVAFDTTGGAAALLTLGARIWEQKVQSATTGKVSAIDTGKFGSQTALNVVEDYLTDKASPIASVIIDLMNRTDFNGNKLQWNWGSINEEAQNAVAPFPIQNYEALVPALGYGGALLAEMADAIGLYVTIRPPKKK